MVAEVKDILSVINGPVQQFDMARFILEKPDMKVREQDQFKILNRSAALENLGNNVDINAAWDILEETSKSMDICEWKQHKLQFDDRYVLRLGPYTRYAEDKSIFCEQK